MKATMKTLSAGIIATSLFFSVTVFAHGGKSWGQGKSGTYMGQQHQQLTTEQQETMKKFAEKRYQFKIEALAEATKISVDSIREQLQSKPLQMIAQENKVSRPLLRGLVQGKTATYVMQSLEEGTLDQDMANRMLRKGKHGFKG
ncbi:MAG: hypothetical protein COB67_13655, partial [SAR324 cluster bacterium]